MRILVFLYLAILQFECLVKIWDAGGGVCDHTLYAEAFECLLDRRLFSGSKISPVAFVDWIGPISDSF